MNSWKKIMKFGKKISNSIKKGFDNEPVYKEKYLKSKIKSYEEKIPKEGSQCIGLLVILINSIYRSGRRI